VARHTAFALFLAVLLALFGGMHYLIWARVARDTHLSQSWQRALGWVLFAAALAVPVGILLARRLSFQAAAPLLAALFTWMGAAFLLFAALLATDVLRLIGAGVRLVVTAAAARVDPPPDPARRALVARALAGGATLAAGSAAAVAVRAAVGEPRVNEVPVQLERLPRALSGYTLAQISDLHVGLTVGEKHVRHVVDMTNALRPDAVVITGDLVDGTVPALRRATEHLARLKARHGVYFVTGNHEFYSGAGPWIEELRRYGIRSLRGERVALGDAAPGGATVDLAGVDDWSVAWAARGRWPALEAALAGRDPERCLVLLAHQPRGVAEAVRSGVELQLSGHTHGGQIFPWTLVVGAIFPYFRGLYTHREEDRSGQVYVSCGTGYWGPPMRLGAPAEVARIVLTA
jgi:predicted MPP superfamily phosphohydrolase